MKKKVHLFITPHHSQADLIKIIKKKPEYGKVVFKDFDLFIKYPKINKKVGARDSEYFIKETDTDIVDLFIRLIKFVNGPISFVSYLPNSIELVYKLSDKVLMNFDLTVHRVTLDMSGGIHSWEIGRRCPKKGQLNINVMLETAFNKFNKIFDDLAAIDNLINLPSIGVKESMYNEKEKNILEKIRI